MKSGNNRKRIGQRFHRHAGEYDQHAIVQKRVVTNLTRLVTTHCSPAPQRALDIGCGTGGMLKALHRLYPHVQLCGLDLAFNMLLRSAAQLGPAAMLVNGDAESLPFGDDTFDLVVSSSTFQWVQRLETCFRECQRVLRPEGVLCIAFFGGRTLWELQESYREALAKRGDDTGRGGRLQHFRTSADVREAMDGLGFSQVVVSTEIEMDYHPDVPALLRSIKGIGATTPARSDSGGGLGWRGLLNDMMAIYRSRFQHNGMIPATYEVIYVIAHIKPFRHVAAV